MKIFLPVLLCLCSSSLFSADWTTYFKNQQVEIQYQYAPCHDEHNGIHQQKVLLRFINLTNQKEAVSFSKELQWSTGKTSTADGKLFSVTLNAHETKEGNCAERDNTLFLFSKQLNFTATELKKFELKNIVVKTIQ